MRYSTHIDYLIASIFYLGTQSYWWARTPRELARELSLEEDKLTAVFEGFPGLFRKSSETSESGQHMYSLQARYAQRDHQGKPDQRVSYIPPLETEKIRLLQDFVLKSAEDERIRKRTIIGNGIAAGAAVVSAVTAIVVALMKAQA